MRTVYKVAIGVGVVGVGLYVANRLTDGAIVDAVGNIFGGKVAETVSDAAEEAAETVADVI